MNIKNISIYGMFLSGLSIMLIGIFNFNTLYEVPSLSRLKEYSGVIEEYSCTNSRFGNVLGLKFKNIDRIVTVRKVEINCDDIRANISNNRNVTVWIDIGKGSPVAYALQTGNIELFSNELGTKRKDVNLLGLIMIVVGSILLFKSYYLNKKHAFL